MDLTTLANPFHVWSELASGLRERFVSELKELGDAHRPWSPYTSETLGKMAALVTQCEHLGISLTRLQEKDPVAYDAFLRALEKS